MKKLLKMKNGIQRNETKCLYDTMFTTHPYRPFLRNLSVNLVQNKVHQGLNYHKKYCIKIIPLNLDINRAMRMIPIGQKQEVVYHL